MICFDTMVVIWGVQGIARQAQRPMIARTKRYIRYLSEKRVQIAIPTPVLFEYLVPFSAEQARAQAEVIEQSFYVPSFDLPASALAAEILRNRELVDAIRAEHRLHKEALKTDAQILAVAITNSAEKLISSDAHMPKLAAGRIPVTDVPGIDDQLELF